MGKSTIFIIGALVVGLVVGYIAGVAMTKKQYASTPEAGSATVPATVPGGANTNPFTAPTPEATNPFENVKLNPFDQ